MQIEKTDGVLGNAACVGKTRIAVWMLVNARQMGLTDEEIKIRYKPNLTDEDLSAAWRYWETHRNEIEIAICANENY